MRRTVDLYQHELDAVRHLGYLLVREYPEIKDPGAPIPEIAKKALDLLYRLDHTLAHLKTTED